MLNLLTVAYVQFVIMMINLQKGLSHDLRMFVYQSTTCLSE